MLAGYQANVPLAPHTTFKTGGAAAYYTTVTTEAELEAALAEASAASLPVTVLGGGSNVLVADTGVAGCVIQNQLGGWHVSLLADGVVAVTAGAGLVWDELVAQSVAEGWWGLENLSAIPGSVGATPIQNVGAYGVEVGDRIVSVRAMHQRDQSVRDFTAAECAFGYRDSFFKTSAGREWVVCAVTYALSTTPLPQLQYRDLATWFTDQTPTQPAIREAVITIRSKKFPDWHQVGTAGSFFQNPIISVDSFAALRERYPELPGYPTADGQVKVALGWILDKVCDLRGVYDGAVGCYEGQALVLVQRGGASSAAVAHFAETVAKQVYEHTGIEIAWEVTLLT